MAVILSTLATASFAAPPALASHENAPVGQVKEVTVTGTVSDMASQPMAGAIVYSPEYNIATMTDSKGRYSITVPKAGVEIQVSFIGYRTFSFTVGARAVQNVVLEDETHTLDDVVVVAYSTQRKATVTGSVAAVNT
ncbi:MAG: carboxypeptidase-like regulatory domain-containing protein, partial [Clostridium sp.]|nr:carboxypeptidase-like regulatory domain-containing protein [Clostridium sp.]